MGAHTGMVGCCCPTVTQPVISRSAMLPHASRTSRKSAEEATWGAAGALCAAGTPGQRRERGITDEWSSWMRAKGSTQLVRRCLLLARVLMAQAPTGCIYVCDAVAKDWAGQLLARSLASLAVFASQWMMQKGPWRDQGPLAGTRSASECTPPHLKQGVSTAYCISPGGMGASS
jgi:hypothetical protein